MFVCVCAWSFQSTFLRNSISKSSRTEADFRNICSISHTAFTIVYPCKVNVYHLAMFCIKLFIVLWPWQQEKSPRLWAFVFGVYWVSFVTYYLLWKAYNHVSELRAAALMSPEAKAKAEQFAILVRDIPTPPEGQTMKEHVD